MLKGVYFGCGKGRVHLKKHPSKVQKSDRNDKSRGIFLLIDGVER